MVLLGYAALLSDSGGFHFLSDPGTPAETEEVLVLFRRLPPLGTLDKLITNAMSFGFVFITLGVIAGSTWASIESGTAWITILASRWRSLPGVSISPWCSCAPPLDGEAARPPSWLSRSCAVPLLPGPLTWGFIPDRQMKFSITGVNHKTAPVEVRERLAFDQGSLSLALLELKRRPGFCEGMILSTCNRVEMALTAKTIPTDSRWMSFWPRPARSRASG